MLSFTRHVLVILTLLASMVGCTTKSSDQQLFHLGGLVFAEPQPVDIRDQILIARYSQFLLQPSLKRDEKAVILYKRGILYDSVGLADLAQYDFSQAIKLKPDLAAAHNSLGVHFIQNGEFDQAYESFDSTLEIDPEFEYALLNRGIALYYGGKAKLSIDDLESFLVNAPSDPFRVLWAYIARADVDPQAALIQLEQDRQNIESANWAGEIVDFYLGKSSETDVMQAVLENGLSSQEIAERLCEAYFYIGKYHSSAGNGRLALNYFKLALSTNVYQYVEHRYARLEIARVRANIRDDFAKRQ